MYQENAVFDQPAMMMSNEEDGFIPNRNTNPNFSIDDHAAISAMEMELQNQLNMEMDQCYNTTTTATNIEIQQIVQEMSSFNGPPSSDYVVQNGHFNTGAAAPHDLLNIFPPLPNKYSPIAYSNHQKSSNSFLASLGLYGDNADIGPSGVVYDPLLPLNMPPQPPLLRDLFHNMPPPHEGYNGHHTLVGGSRNNNNGCNLFDDQTENGSEGFFYQNNDNGVFEFSAGGGGGGGGEMNNINININNRDLINGKDIKHYTNTERHRRVLMNDKYQALRNLLANPTKNDRASIVADAIDYINELKRSVGELKLLVEKKRCASERMKRLKTEDAANDEGGINGESSKSLVDMDHHPCNGSTLRSSWLHRKSKNTEVDVRIIDDEVTVKLVQQKRINCLLFVSKVLDELQLDLHHVAGGLIGDYYSFLFNSKICEGSIVYASAIANKLIEVVDKHYATIPPSNSY